jgi:hypothetical protein
MADGAAAVEPASFFSRLKLPSIRRKSAGDDEKGPQVDSTGLHKKFSFGKARWIGLVLLVAFMGVRHWDPGPLNTIRPGVDIEVNYVDFRDASGEIIEVGDGAAVRANTGSITLDRTVYPVPFGNTAAYTDNSAATPSGRSIFPVHASGLTGGINTAGENIQSGDLTIHVRVNDPDYDISAAGEDKIATGSANSSAPVKVSVIRGASTVILGYAGTSAAVKGTIDTDGSSLGNVRTFGPMVEIAPDAGIFEADITIRYTDGPASASCPTTNVFTNIKDDSGTGIDERFDVASSYSGNPFCILQGDILQVEYTDSTDASG